MGALLHQHSCQCECWLSAPSIITCLCAFLLTLPPARRLCVALHCLCLAVHWLACTRLCVPHTNLEAINGPQPVEWKAQQAKLKRQQVRSRRQVKGKAKGQGEPGALRLGLAAPQALHPAWPAFYRPVRRLAWFRSWVRHNPASVNKGPGRGKMTQGSNQGSPRQKTWGSSGVPVAVVRRPASEEKPRGQVRHACGLPTQAPRKWLLKLTVSREERPSIKPRACAPLSPRQPSDPSRSALVCCSPARSSQSRGCSFWSPCATSSGSEVEYCAAG